MEDPTLLRKFVRPTLPQGILHREPLVNYLQEVIAGKSQQDEVVTLYKLVLLCAPAGYGKTTLLADFASATPIDCCWYFLDETDIDYVVFLRRLFASIHHTFPGLSPVVSASLSHLSLRESLAPAAVYQPILDTLCKLPLSWLSSGEPACLIVRHSAVFSQPLIRAPWKLSVRSFKRMCSPGTRSPPLAACSTGRNTNGL